MANRIQKVSLEKITKEKLGKQVLKDIDSIEVEVWENVEAGLSLAISKKTIALRLNYIVSTKKFLTWFGGIVTAIGGSLTALKWLIPILIKHFTRSP